MPSVPTGVSKDEIARARRDAGGHLDAGAVGQPRLHRVAGADQMQGLSPGQQNAQRG